MVRQMLSFIMLGTVSLTRAMDQPIYFLLMVLVLIIQLAIVWKNSIQSWAANLQGDETAYPYKEKGHGMFTYFLLKKLQESNGDASLGEIADYVIENVRKQSIVTNGKMQTPTLIPSSQSSDWRKWKLR